MTCPQAWGLFMGFLLPGILAVMLLILVVIALISTEPNADRWKSLFGVGREHLSVVGLTLLLIISGVCIGFSAFGWEAYRSLSCDSSTVRVSERGVPKT